jgi:uncharacterized protein YjbJ (UPF0337 family)
MTEQKKDLRTQGQEDTLKGKLNQAAGKVQSKVGQATGNKRMQAKGKARQVGGKVQEKAGQVKQNVDASNNPDQPTTYNP